MSRFACWSSSSTTDLLPSVPQDYVHRIRAGLSGKAISLFSSDETKQLNDIEKVLKAPIERQVIPGFEPNLSTPRAPLPRNFNNNRRGSAR